MTHVRILSFSLLALLSMPAAPALASDPYADERRAFQRAYARAEAGQDAAHQDSEALRTYPLYPYLQAARIRRALSETRGGLGPADERAETFIIYYRDEPVGRSLARTWLVSLAERRQWTQLLERYRDELANDALECRSLEARIELGRHEGLDAAIAKRWLTPRSILECERPFDWLRSRNALSPELIEQRVRLALEENNPRFARQIAASLPAERAAPLHQWAALLENPAREIDALIASPGKAVLDEALLAGWTRLARRNRDAALERYERLVRARKLSAEARSPYALALALPLSWDRRPEALAYFSKVQPAELDDYALEWQARAALWSDDFERAARVIAAMSDDQREHARWRYWAGRAAERRDDAPLARQLYESVLIDDNFYSVMAAARLDRPLAPHQKMVVLDETLLASIEQLPALVRARELLRCDERSLANVEWIYGFDQLPEPARTQALHLASRWGWHEQAVATATKLRVFNDYELLYPRPYDRDVQAAARLSKLPSQLIYGVMRQESLYRADAISPAGARGLLQMLPETARRTARKWQRARPSTSDLLEPRINVPLGAAHLRDLHERFNGQTLVALAAYNAGPNAAARWLPDRPIEPDVWVENIPYNETRNYVQRILWHQLVFTWLETGKPERTDAWLTRVKPLEEEAALGRL